MNLNELEPQTEIIAKAIADGVTTVAEYAHWLGGYTTATKECTKHVKESHDLSWLEPDWQPTRVSMNGEQIVPYDGASKWEKAIKARNENK